MNKKGTCKQRGKAAILLQLSNNWLKFSQYLVSCITDQHAKPITTVIAFSISSSRMEGIIRKI